MSSNFIPTNKNSAAPKQKQDPPRATDVVKREYGDALLALGQARLNEIGAKNQQAQLTGKLQSLSDEYTRAQQAEQESTPAEATQTPA